MLMALIFNHTICHAQSLNYPKVKVEKVLEVYKSNEKKFYPKTIIELNKNKSNKRNLSAKEKKALDQELDDLDRALLEMNKALNSK